MEKNQAGQKVFCCPERRIDAHRERAARPRNDAVLDELHGPLRAAHGQQVLEPLATLGHACSQRAARLCSGEDVEKAFDPGIQRHGAARSAQRPSVSWVTVGQR